MPDQRILSTVINLLVDPMSDVRKEAAITLGKLANQQSLQALEQTLEDLDRDISIYAERAIKEIQKSLLN